MNTEDNGIAYAEIVACCTVEKCGAAIIPQFVSVGSDGSIRIVGYCNKCRRNYHHTLSREMIEDMKPPPPTGATQPAQTGQPKQGVASKGETQYDIAFMRAMKIGPTPPETDTE